MTDISTRNITDKPRKEIAEEMLRDLDEDKIKEKEE